MKSKPVIMSALRRVGRGGMWTVPPSIEEPPSAVADVVESEVSAKGGPVY